MDRERPILVGITADLADGRAVVSMNYVRAVAAAGGTPIILPPLVRQAAADAAAFDAFVFTGGDDPVMEVFGRPTHPQAQKMNPDRQAYELALLHALAESAPEKPVLGVCLGMQLMALHAGGDLNQHMPDDVPTHEDHRGDRRHDLRPTDAAPAWLEAGEVASHHRQAVSDAGKLAVAAYAHDGIIEAVADPKRTFYVGVQWHPERTPGVVLGQRLFDELVSAARR